MIDFLYFNTGRTKQIANANDELQGATVFTVVTASDTSGDTVQVEINSTNNGQLNNISFLYTCI